MGGSGGGEGEESYLLKSGVVAAIVLAAGGSDRLFDADEAGLDGAGAGAPVGGGGGGGALLRRIEEWESEFALPTLATDTVELMVDDLTLGCLAPRGMGGSNPTRGPPCCRMYSLINSRFSAIISSVIPWLASSAYRGRHSSGG